MAISDRIRAEANRTIDGMQKFYEKYSDDTDDAEELEHRIARVEASMEGCNGLTQDEKIQKTAENVFELTCAQERSYDAIRREIKITRDEYKEEFRELRTDLKKGLDDVMKKIEDSGEDSESDSDASISAQKAGKSLLTKIISEHPLLAFNSFVFLLLLVFVSGHFDDILKLFPK